MSIVPADVQNQVIEVLQQMDRPVKLVMFTKSGPEQCETCKETRDLVEEIANLSDRLQFEAYDIVQDEKVAAQYKIDKTPALAILAGGDQPRDYGIRLYGIPSGYEFSSLISDIVLVSRGQSGLNDQTLQQVGKLENPVHIQVFVTPTCPYCPQAVILAHRLALASDKITADMVESMEFQELASRYQVYGVPRTVINDVVHIEGAVPEKALVAELMKVLDEDVMRQLRRQWDLGLN